MSGRDLLHKPSTPQQLRDETTGDEKKKVGVNAPRGRDIGQVGDTVGVRAPAGRTSAQDGNRPAAYKAAYFNQDVSGVSQVNQRQSTMQALRGSEGATDLRRVVLPASSQVESPNPAQLRDASKLMGLESEEELNLESLLGRLGGWLKDEGVTVEMIEARLSELEEMVAARKAALVRMAAAHTNGRPVTVEQAVIANGKALEATEDVVEAGRELVERTASQAAGMHARIAKMLGIEPR